MQIKPEVNLTFDKIVLSQKVTHHDRSDISESNMQILFATKTGPFPQFKELT